MVATVLLLAAFVACRQAAPTGNAPETDLKTFLDNVDTTLLRLSNEVNQTGWTQATYINVDTELLSAKATPEPNTYRSNLRSRGSHERGPIGLTMQARVNPRPLLGILAERTGLIAKKGPPRLCWRSASCRHVA